VCCELVRVYFTDAESLRQSWRLTMIAIPFCRLLIDVQRKLIRVIGVVYPMCQLVGEGEAFWSHVLIEKSLVP
jgi:hypothetical protein